MLELRKMNWEDAPQQWRYVTAMPENEICLRVLKSNPASFAVIRNNGGYVAGEDEEHYLLRIRK